MDSHGAGGDEAGPRASFHLSPRSPRARARVLVSDGTGQSMASGKRPGEGAWDLPPPALIHAFLKADYGIPATSCGPNMRPVARGFLPSTCWPRTLTVKTAACWDPAGQPAIPGLSWLLAGATSQWGGQEGAHCHRSQRRSRAGGAGPGLGRHPGRLREPLFLLLTQKPTQELLPEEPTPHSAEVRRALLHKGALTHPCLQGGQPGDKDPGPVPSCLDRSSALASDLCPHSETCSGLRPVSPSPIHQTLGSHPPPSDHVPGPRLGPTPGTGQPGAPEPHLGTLQPGAPPATDAKDLPSPRPTGSRRRALLGML